MAVDRKRKSMKIGGKNAHDDVVSFQLHCLSMTDPSNLQEVETLVKTYNSAARCAFKRFRKMGLNGLFKGNHGKRNFWQIDREVGSPVRGTIMALREWLMKNGLYLDSTLLQNAVMSGMKTCRSFEKKLSKWQTSKDSPSFGDMDARSRNRLTKEEFQLTRNGSMTVIGKTKLGNPKFRLDVENQIASFIHRRKRIEFSFKSNRFSKKGMETLNLIADGMKSGKLPVTMTLTITGNGRFNLTLTYSQEEFRTLKKERSRLRSSVVSGIWVSDEVIHHQVIDAKRNRVLHSRTWKVEAFSGEKQTRKYLDDRISHHDWKTVNSIKGRIANRTAYETGRILEKIFKTSSDYGAKTMVVETPRHKTKRDFNCSYISCSKDRILNGPARPCFMTYSKLVKMVQTKCHRFGMELGKVDGTFIQLKAILESHSMADAIKNACTTMVGRFTDKSDDRLTDWRRWMSNPSMLDWVGHLLHNKRSRQARSEIRKAFNSRAVEKAVRLVDNRYGLGGIVS